MLSIDGIKEEHDSRRIYKNGKGTYDIILENERAIAKEDVSRLYGNGETAETRIKIDKMIYLIRTVQKKMSTGMR